MLCARRAFRPQSAGNGSPTVSPQVKKTGWIAVARGLLQAITAAPRCPYPANAALTASGRIGRSRIRTPTAA
jgi:hypothetical protein